MVINGTNPGLLSFFYIEALWRRNILASYPHRLELNLSPPHLVVTVEFHPAIEAFVVINRP